MLMDKSFLLAGRATFTVSNPQSESYTFRVVRMEPNDKFPRPAFSVYVLAGPDNENDYVYVGIMSQESGSLRHTQKSVYAADSRLFRVAAWSIGIIWEKRAIPDGYRIEHDGRCSRCGRTLTTIESIDAGIGPECRKHVMAIAG